MSIVFECTSVIRSRVEDTISGLRDGEEDLSDCISIGHPALLSTHALKCYLSILFLLSLPVSLPVSLTKKHIAFLSVLFCFLVFPPIHFCVFFLLHT